MKRLSGYWFALPHLLLFGLFLVGPLLFGLLLGFFHWEMLSGEAPAFVGLANFHEALADPYFWRALKATALFVILALPATILLALLLALAVNILPRRQAFYRACFMLPTMVNIAVAGVLWRWFYNDEFGLFNALLEPLGLTVPWISDTDFALPSVVLMTIWWTSGTSFLILLTGLQQISANLYEAAALDGAIGWQRFLYITLPLLRPALFFVGIMNLIGSFQVFGQTYVITGGGPEQATRTLVQYIYETAFGNYRMGYGAAMSWLLFLVIAAFAMLQFRLTRRRDTP